MNGLLSTESIQFQNDMFFQELAMVIEPLRKVSDIQRSAELQALEAVINHHTGINLRIETDNIDDDVPSIYIPQLDKNNVLVAGWRQALTINADANRLIQQAGDGMVRGGVDLRTGKVTGAFADILVTLALPPKLLKGSRYTNEELAAKLLHECGHYYVFCEFLGRTVTTNQVLAGISRGLDKTDSQHERKAILMNAKKALALTELDVEELSLVTDKSVVSAVIVRNVMKQAVSEIGSNVYDCNTWEYLSDQYATRMGAGRHLITALDKLGRDADETSFRSTSYFLFMEGAKVVMGLAAIGAATTGPAGIILGFFFTGGLLLWAAADGVGSSDYDRPGTRFKRIRNQLVERLKVKKSPEDQKRTREDIAACDLILEGVNDRLPWLSVIATWMSPATRERLRAEELQQQLETLASNNLFVKASELKSLA